MRFFGNPLHSVMDAGLAVAGRSKQAASRRRSDNRAPFKNPAGAQSLAGDKCPGIAERRVSWAFCLTWLPFTGGFEQASDRELLARRDEALNMESRISDEDLKRDLRRLVRMIEEELVARKFRV